MERCRRAAFCRWLERLRIVGWQQQFRLLPSETTPLTDFLETMLEYVKKLLCVLVMVCGVKQASAFSLIGPFDTWQVTTVGYNFAGDLGGPQNIGEEYRWVTHMIVYGLDLCFIYY